MYLGEPLDERDEFAVVMGNEQLMSRLAIPVDSETAQILLREQLEGRISILCAVNGNVVAIVSIADNVKKEAAIAVWALEKMGMRVVILSGDNAKTAAATAKQVSLVSEC